MNAERRHPNETLRLLTERSSCRDFTDRRIPRDVLRRIFEAGVHGATGGNLQPYSIVQIERAATREELAQRCRQPFIARAPLNLILCIDFLRLERWARLEAAPFTARQSFYHFWIAFQDTVICAQNLCIAADSLGLGSVYVGTVLEFVPRLRSLLHLPRGVFPVVLLCLGYPKSRPTPKARLGPDLIVHRERYRVPSDRKLSAAFSAKYRGVRLDIDPPRLKRIEEACRNTRGAAFARRCLARIQRNGHITRAQSAFGLVYRADRIPLANREFMRQVAKSGFGWFAEYRRSNDGIAISNER